MQPIIDKLCAVSERIGWPEAFKSDLWHDAEWLRDNRPARFLWLVRATGTHIYGPDAGADILRYLPQPHRYFAYEPGMGFVELDHAQALQWLAGPDWRQRMLGMLTAGQGDDDAGC